MLTRIRSGIALRKKFVPALLLLACAAGLHAADRPSLDEASRLARQILQAAGVEGGLVVHLGCGDGKITAALRSGESFLVRGIDADPAEVAAAQEHIDGKGLYGPVSVECRRGSDLPYVDNLVNLLVVSHNEGGVTVAEMLRVLAPGGAALISGGESVIVEGGQTPPRLVEIAGSPWKLIRKPWPAGIDEWTHWLHGADGNPVAKDTVVGLPRRAQWFAEPRWSRSHEKSPSLTGMVSARGRLFYICDEAPPNLAGPLPDQWRLVARDAFSGVLLWKRPVGDWGWQAWSPAAPLNFRWGNPRFIHRRLVAAGDRVYVTLGYSAAVSALDAATGETVRVYEGTENTCEILCHQGLLVVSAATEPKTATDRAPPLKIMAVEAATGQVLWEAGPFPSLFDLGERGKSSVLKQGHLMIAAGGGHVFAVTEQEIVALRLDDGRRAWSVTRPEAVLRDAGEKARGALGKLLTNLGSLMVRDGRVYYAQPQVPANKLVNASPMTLLCLSASTGEELWRRISADWSYTTSLNVYAARGMIWVHDDPRTGPYDLVGLDPATGAEKIRYNLQSVLTTRHHHRCYRNKATENFLLMGKEGVECVDLETGNVLPNRWLRGTCLYGVMPANGLLYAPPHACSCNPMTLLQGYWALAPAASQESAFTDHPAERLQKGPAYGATIEPGTANPQDWPMHRRDSLRSGATPATVEVPLRECWTASLGGDLTAPVVAGGRMYCGRRDAHELVALGVDTGTVVWRRRLGGSIDSPPTVYQGLVLAGCSDGSVYCLRASDGALVWQFQAAPQARCLVAENRLESVWPVHGSVIVHNGLAYVAAGRSSYLDGGIRFYALDPASGAVIKEKTFFTEQQDQEAYFDGATSDLLVSDGASLFLRHLRLDPETLEVTRVGSWSFKGPGAEAKGGAPAPPEGSPVFAAGGSYLRGGQSLLDDSLFGRTQLHLDGGEACHLLSFDAARTYGFQMSTNPGHFTDFTPGAAGYSILCFDRGPAAKRKPQKLWEEKMLLRVGGMVLAGEKLFLAGVPDVVDPDDPLASFEGRMGASLVALEASSGANLAELKLDAPPVFDGLIAANRRLYLADRAGSIRCFGGGESTGADQSSVHSPATGAGK